MSVEYISVPNGTPDLSGGFPGTPIAPNGDHAGDTNGSETSPTVQTEDGSRVKPKQKRNKPTLSCLECVERKTKCDRGRPCLASEQDSKDQ